MVETSIQKWVNLKYDVKKFSISFSINSQKKIKGQIRNIEKRNKQNGNTPLFDD